jgi:hypothetical protein
MFEEEPPSCLFCCSRVKQTDHHNSSEDPPPGFGWDKGREEGCFRFLCQLLGLTTDDDDQIPSRSTSTLEGILIDKEEGLPFCSSCSLAFRHLCQLQDELVSLQEKINLVAEQIRSKIKSSEHDGSSALAFTLQSISSGGDGTEQQQRLASLAWMQQFRERVILQSTTTIGECKEVGAVDFSVYCIKIALANFLKWAIFFISVF